MTKLKFSGVGITGMAGAIGSRVITRNFYGYYSKVRIPGPAVTSPALAAWQAQFSAIEAVWKILTDAQRSAWASEAQRNYWRTDKLARKERHTGYGLFMYVNLNRNLVALATLTDPPTYISPPVITITNIVYTPAITFSIFYDVSINGAQAIYFTNYLSPGRMSTNQIYMLSSGGAGTITAGSWSIDILPQITARLGPPVSGKKIYIRMDPLSTSGKRSAPSYLSYIFP